jgi:hypothetical protein
VTKRSEPALCFRSRIEISGINPYVPVSAARAAKLKAGWRKPMPVLVRVNGKPDTPWRINMMPVGDSSFYLYLHGTVREQSGTGVGDTVHVEVSFDESYRGGPAALPVWFKRALQQDAQARSGWKALAPSRKKEVVRYLANLKSPDAQRRNLDKVLHVLGGGKARFMARSWNDGENASGGRATERDRPPSDHAAAKRKRINRSEA